MNLEKQIKDVIKKAQNTDIEHFTSEKAVFSFALSCIDLTTLEGTDTEKKVSQLCQHAKEYTPCTAAVCIFPAFIRCAKNALKGTDIQIATVVGGFPYGVLPNHLKISEIKYSLEEGTDELDLVFSRGDFLSGNTQSIENQIHTTKELCQKRILKVILETGELQSIENIALASKIAINGGADFLKTSTGKVALNATPEAFATMAIIIKNYFEKTGNAIGIKVAGGIKDISSILLYIRLLEIILGKQWLTKKLFRIGTSRLANLLDEKLKF
ncbi:MAG: deoxyribose-phosphate aldolase [Bacteroidales bacterium]|jgi:deoxyribose-phosphate aldolase|nr:deoxyribose-phosphate aldolase [Bacteroidales bacterium]